VFTNVVQLHELNSYSDKLNQKVVLCYCIHTQS